MGRSMLSASHRARHAHIDVYGVRKARARGGDDTGWGAHLESIYQQVYRLHHTSNGDTCCTRPRISVSVDTTTNDAHGLAR